MISNCYFFLTDSTSRQAKICTLWHKLPWFSAVEIKEPPPNLLWSSCADVRPLGGPRRHKGSRPPLDITMQSPISSWLFMGRACLRQHGCYSVLGTNMAAALYTPAAVLFCCRVVQRGHTGPFHTVFDSGGGKHFCCCIHTKHIK